MTVTVTSEDEMASKEESMQLKSLEESNNEENKEELLPKGDEYPAAKARILIQVLSVVVVSFGCLIHGTVVVYVGVATESLFDATNPNSTNYIGFTIDHQTQYPIIASIAALGMLLGSLGVGSLCDAIGRKYTLLIGLPGCLGLAYICIALAVNVWMMYLGRVLAGAGLGISQTVSTLYIAEVATPEMRGPLAVIPAIAGTLGLLTTQILGSMLNWKNLAIVCACLNIPFTIMILFIPESPVYLVSKKKIEQAESVLVLLRGSTWDVKKELAELTKSLTGQIKYRVTMSDFFTKSVIKPFSVALGLMFFFQLSGISCILNYTPEIFRSASSSVDPYYATIYLGCALLISNGITLYIVGRVKRKIMMLTSAFGVSVTLAIMGLCYHLNALKGAKETILLQKAANETMESQENNEEQVDNSILGWVPLFDLMAYIFFFNLGYGAMIWMTVAEILPTRTRSITNSLSVGFTSIISFIALWSFPLLEETLTRQGTFWLYAAISMLGFFFIAIFVPETKGKTEKEIQAYFNITTNETENATETPLSVPS